MKMIHRYYESISEDSGLLHDVCYDTDTENKVVVSSLQTHIVSNGNVERRIISNEDPLNKVSMIASYSILVKDGAMDIDANLLIQ
jgi:hypothetical protein